MTLKKKWFKMILAGEKKEEYREIKPYWDIRLKNKNYDYILFKNGYSKNSPSFLIELKNIKIGKGKPEWGACQNKVYILSLGKIIKKPLKQGQEI